jgi:succinate dehydrogenase flavin-adding protein (antitoxin of CptAB toxin-antitoxin module)
MNEETKNCLVASSPVIIGEAQYPFWESLDGEQSLPPNEVIIIIPYDDHEIKAVILWNGKRWVTRITKDGKDPLGLEYRKQLYIADKTRDADIIRWLKQKFDCKKQDADLVLDMIRAAADSKQQEIDCLPTIQAAIEKINKSERKVPGYEEYKLYTISDFGAIIPDIDAISCAIMEKLDIISYDKLIWEYRNGIYSRDDRQTHEEIVKIFKYISYNESVRSKAQDIVYCIINSHHTRTNPFNRFPGIPLANGVLEIDFYTGGEKLIEYSPEQKFSYKLPVKYNRQVPTDPVIKLLRTWVEEKDINILIQIAAQTLLQKIFNVTYKKFYLFNGAPDSGKSAYIILLLKLLSIEDEISEFGYTKNNSSISLKKLTQDKFAKSGLRDKLINAYNDMPQFYLEDTGDFKDLIGSVSNQGIEEKYKNLTTTSLTAVHVFACNQLPFVAKKVIQDEAFWPKMEYVYFPYHYKKVDNWEEKNLTDDICSGFLNLVIDMMKQIRQQHSLVVDNEGEDLLRRFMEDSQPLTRFIKLNMVRAKIPVRYDKRQFMLKYIEHCKDKDIDDMESIKDYDIEDIYASIAMMNTFEEKEYTDMMKLINRNLIGFSKKLFKTKEFKDVHTVVYGVEKNVYEGGWQFREGSKYKTEPI